MTMVLSWHHPRNANAVVLGSLENILSELRFASLTHVSCVNLASYKFLRGHFHLCNRALTAVELKLGKHLSQDTKVPFLLAHSRYAHHMSPLKTWNKACLCSSSFCCPVQVERPPLTGREATSCRSRGHLLHAERPPLASREATSCRSRYARRT